MAWVHKTLLVSRPWLVKVHSWISRKTDFTTPFYFAKTFLLLSRDHFSRSKVTSTTPVETKLVILNSINYSYAILWCVNNNFNAYYYCLNCNADSSWLLYDQINLTNKMKNESTSSQNQAPYLASNFAMLLCYLFA